MHMEALVHFPPGELKPSPFNPRTEMDADKLASLAESIKQGGIYEPIIARRVNGDIEIVAGERRWRAAQKAKVETVPVIIRELSDAEALEVQLVENEQREDVSALDQAAGFRKLMELDPATYTAETIATRIGLKAASVYLRLKLLALTNEAKDLFRSGKIEAGHAVLIARLAHADQHRAVAYIQQGLKHDQQTSVRELKAWITREVKIDLFGPELAELQPAVAAKLAKLKDKGVEVVQLSRQYRSPEDVKKSGVLGQNEYREAGKKKCAATKPGAFVYGEKVEMVDVCTDQKCKTHWPELHRARQAKSAATRQAKESPAAKTKRLAAEAAAKRKREVEEQLRGKVLREILATTKAISRPVLQALVAIALEMGSVIEFQDDLAEFKLEPFLKYSRDGSVLAKATDRQLAQVAVLAIASEEIHGNLPAVAKRFGVNLKKLEKGLQTAAAKPAPEKPGKAAATARKKR